MYHRDVCRPTADARAFTRWAARRRNGAGSPESTGFTVIEVVIAITVLLVILIPTSQLMVRGVLTTADTRLRVVAANLATQQLEKARAEPFASITIGRTSTTQTVAGRHFTIFQDAEFTQVGLQQSDCTSVSQGNQGNSQQILRVSAEVAWTNQVDIQPVTISTLVTPPVGYFNPNTGQIGVQVLSAAGSPQPGVLVTVTGPGTSPQAQTLTTTADGCAYFVNLAAPNNYTVSLSEPGYVSDQGVANPSKTVGASVGQTEIWQPLYDLASTLNFTLATTAAQAATGLPTTVSNSHLQPVGWISTATGATSMGSLFPFTDGYGAWSGDCQESNPLGTDGTGQQGQPLYPGAVAPTPVDLPAGSTQPVTVDLNSLLLSVTDKTLGTPIVGATMTATEDGVNCPVHVYGLQTTDVNGMSSTGLPLGQLKITVPLGGRTTTLYVWVTPTGVLPEASGGQQDPTGTPYAGAAPIKLP